MMDAVNIHGSLYCAPFFYICCLWHVHVSMHVPCLLIMGPPSSPSTPSILVWGPDDLLATVSYLVHKLQYLYLVWHISLDHSYSLPFFLSYLLLLLLLPLLLFLSSFIHPSSSSPPLPSSPLFPPPHLPFSSSNSLSFSLLPSFLLHLPLPPPFV